MQRAFILGNHYVHYANSKQKEEASSSVCLFNPQHYALTQLAAPIELNIPYRSAPALAPVVQDIRAINIVVSQDVLCYLSLQLRTAQIPTSLDLENLDMATKTLYTPSNERKRTTASVMKGLFSDHTKHIMNGCFRQNLGKCQRKF
jgi:hypothetical protein